MYNSKPVTVMDQSHSETFHERLIIEFRKSFSTVLNIFRQFYTLYTVLDLLDTSQFVILITYFINHLV